jgi:hypothetical protein
MEAEHLPQRGEALLQGSWVEGRQDTLAAKLVRYRPWGWKLATVMYLREKQGKARMERCMSRSAE